MKWLAILSLLSLIGCASINHDSNILLQDPYNKIAYSSNIDNGEPKDIVELTLSSSQANILNTIPSLYNKVLERHSTTDNQIINITNLLINNYSESKNVTVSYQECVSEPKMGLNGQTTYSQKCSTKYRNEIQHTLFQKVTAEVY